ncbi:hypothetical protein NHX12_028233 [Muraenolepis orangiensis]|nr:hypothetical protein NHX12_028233 [Muraenolepis orangiensis]
MKIAVLGATGQTGQYLVSQALQSGHVVTAIVRNPGKITEKHDNLKVVEADIFSADSLKTHFQDQDAVVSCLGFPSSFFYGVTGYTLSMSAVVGAMRDAKVSQLIAMTSWYTEPNSGAQAPFLIRNLLLPMIRSLLSNMYEMETALEAVDDLTWTVVRPPGLRSLPATDKELLTHEGYSVPEDLGNWMARGDVARFMLSLLQANAWGKKGVAIHSK